MADYFIPLRAHHKIVQEELPPLMRRLIYTARMTEKRQPVLAGRVILEPDVDLADYVCTALLDWLELGFVAQNQHYALNVAQTVNRGLVARGFRGDCWVSGVERKAGYYGHFFLIKIFDATPEKVDVVREQLFSGYQMHPFFAGDGLVITGIELAIDFAPALDLLAEELEVIAARQKMSEVLRKHIHVDPIFLEDEHDQPRVYNGSSRPIIRRRHPLPAKYAGSPGLDERARAVLQPKNHLSGRLNGTYYIGDDESPVMFRLQDKVSDSWGETTGRKPLPVEARRSRIEVRLQRDDLTETGLETSIGLGYLQRGTGAYWSGGLWRVSDLAQYRFEVLRKPMFDFFLPTIDPRFGRSGEEWRIFEHSGTYGLDAYQRALAVAQADASLRSKGKRQSFDEMNERVRKALLRLSQTWRRLPRRSARA